MYKVLERIILKIIQSYNQDMISVKQTGFKKYQEFEEQVLSLITLIESGFQRKLVKKEKKKKD